MEHPCPFLGPEEWRSQGTQLPRESTAEGELSITTEVSFPPSGTRAGDPRGVGGDFPGKAGEVLEAEGGVE